MHYNEAIGSYWNDDYERILDTEFRFDIPYLIDKEKYASVLEKYHQRQRVKDADVVVFSCHYDKEEDDEFFSVGECYTFFSFPQNSLEGSDDFYECIQFNGSPLPYEQYEQFVGDMLECVIGPSIEHCMTIMSDIRNNMCKESEYLEMIQTIISQPNTAKDNKTK